MAMHASDLAVRRHERYLCDLPALISVEDPAVRLSRGALGTEGKLPARVVDLSRGGLGLSAGVYLPPTCLLRVEFEAPDGRGGQRRVAASVRVQRAAMADRTPRYYIGAGFEGAERALEEGVVQALAALKAAGATVMPEKARA